MKIQTAAVAALQRTRGRAGVVVQQRRLLLAPVQQTTTSISIAQHGNHNLNRNYYHSQSCAFAAQQNNAVAETDAAADDAMLTMPPNLMFDFKSSFAPTPAVTDEEISSSLQEEDEDGDDESNRKDDELESSRSGDIDYDEDEDEYDDEDEDDITAPLVFNPNAITNAQHRPVQPLPDRLQMPIRDGPNGSLEEDAIAGTIWLDPTVFGLDEIRIDLVKQNINYIRNKIRGVRKAKSKTISEKSGSGRKVRAQKGGGQARAGHSRPAHWRGGAKAHGPKNTKDYGNTKLNKRVKTLAMRSMLSQKLKEGNLVVVNHLQLESHKTGPWARILEQHYGVGKAMTKREKRNTDKTPTTTALILDHYLEEEGSKAVEKKKKTDNGDDNDNDYHASYHGVPINLWVASSNIPRVTVRNHRFLNVYDILKNEKLIITLSALEQIEQKWRE